MSAPIPINSGTPPTQTSSHLAATANPHGPGHGHQSSSSTSTISSLSPTTPHSANFPVSSTAPGAAGANFKWASAFGNLGKSPTSPPKGAGNPLAKPTIVHDDDHHDEHHDAFEFGDIHDLTKGSWTGHGRRTASMSAASGQAGVPGVGAAPVGGGGIASMLTGFGASPVSPPPPGLAGVGSPPAAAAGSFFPPGGVVAENVAKGQGVLRRLSLGGGLSRPTFLSPNSQSSSLPQVSPPAAVSASGPPAPGPDLAQRGRRYSENVSAGTKKRGVSPMGERLLRDHVHF